MQINKHPLLGNMKIDQIAFFSDGPETTAKIKESLNLASAEWIEDEVFAIGSVSGEPDQSNRAKLLFNYDFGIEVEILQYLEGANYCDRLGIKPGAICHIGMHVDKGVELQDDASLARLFGFPIIQQVRTQTHTNEYLLSNGRKYQYTIYDTTPLLGVCLKVIERIEVDNA